MRLVAWRLKSLHQLAGIDAETSGQLEQVMEVEVAPSTLDLSEEGPVDADLVGHRLLTEAENVPTVADSLAKDLGGWG